MQYKILDLFAGAGGLSLGFESTKLFTVAAIVENNKNATKTYMKNHIGLKNYEDILDVDFKQLIRENGEIDVVIGGPPCQGFSNANRQRRNLINGSNELVKKYVEAIKEINPKIFVMENVKTIASDKHSFCLTYKDENYIKKDLKLQIHEKESILYEGENVTKVYQLYENKKNEIDKIILMTEEQLYILYNIYKKRNRLEQYLSKESNIKKLITIIETIEEKDYLPQWYNQYTKEVVIILKNIIDTKGREKNYNIDCLKEFWNIQRFYQGIKELTDKDAIFTVNISNQSLNIRMETYIVIDYLRSSFEYLGYVTNEKILNAASFGVPQTRERFLLVGVNKKFKNINKEEIILPDPIIENPSEYLTVGDAIKDLEEYEPTTGSMDVDLTMKEYPNINTYYKKMVMNENQRKIYNHVCTLSRETAIERFKQIGQGENFHSLPIELKNTYENPSRTQNTIYKRLNYNKPSDTVVNVRKSMWIHPNLDRAVSAREAARLQSFPDSYKFYGTKDSVYQQIGNAVPPLLGRAVAETVIELLNNEIEYLKLKDIFEQMKIKKGN